MKTLLKKYFGYETFRPLQEEIIDNVINQKDTFVLMPTGGGKSLCYQLPALHFEGVTLVISPLIALMKDQVDSLKANGVPAAFINSSLSFNEIKQIQNKALTREIKILYVAPERLAQSYFQEFLHQLNLSLIAIDEAHCISEWGHDFRPDYRNLRNLRDLFPQVPLIALTATATQKVIEDILKQLQLNSPKQFKASFNRENLNFTIVKKKDSLEKILYYLQKYPQESAIIYCFSRKDTEKIALALTEMGHPTLAYHAGLSAEERKETQEKFIHDKVSIITATIAFGMGIDKSNIRLIIHNTFPKSMEGYYQEVGRAGRDGLKSECVLLFGEGDRWRHQYFIDQIQDPILKRTAESKLDEVIHYARRQKCRRDFILNYFGEKPAVDNCQACDICLKSEPDKVFQANTEARQKEMARVEVEFNVFLFEELRHLRRTLAEKEGVPPYIIFSDKSLQEMTYYYPMTREDFLKITGVTENKLEKFGDLFLSEITGFCLERNLESRPIVHNLRKVARKSGSQSGAKDQITFQMLQKKTPLQVIAQKHDLKVGTIIQHLERIKTKNPELDLDYLKPDPQVYHLIKTQLLKSTDGKLRPIYQALGEKFSYEDIRLVRLFENAPIAF